MFGVADKYLWQTYEEVPGGADPKMWVTDGANRFLLKRGQSRFPLEPYSEYVASRILKGVGVPVQDVDLVRFRGEIWAKCSDVGEICQFKDISDSSIFSDVNKEFWQLEDLLATIAGMRKFSSSQRIEFIEMFKLLFVVDALIANGDRHAGNFGYTRTGTMAKVYDNGAALFPDIYTLASKGSYDVESLLHAITVDLPISSIQLEHIGRHKQKCSYWQMLSESTVLNDKINFLCSLDIENIVLTSVSGLPEVFQRFYAYVLTLRYKVILQRMEFQRAYNSLKLLPFSIPESVGELCSQLKI